MSCASVIHGGLGIESTLVGLKELLYRNSLNKGVDALKTRSLKMLVIKPKCSKSLY